MIEVHYKILTQFEEDQTNLLIVQLGLKQSNTPSLKVWTKD